MMPFPRPALPFGACEDCGASPCECPPKVADEKDSSSVA